MLKTVLIAAGALVAVTAASLPASAANASFGMAISSSQGTIEIRGPGYRNPGYRGPSRGHFRHQRVLSPRDVTRHLHRQGFQRVHGLQQRGAVYTARAVQRHSGARAMQRRGGWVQVSVNARTGQVVSVRRIR